MERKRRESLEKRGQNQEPDEGRGVEIIERKLAGDGGATMTLCTSHPFFLNPSSYFPLQDYYDDQTLSSFLLLLILTVLFSHH